jgi:hypothetical protein
MCDSPTVALLNKNSPRAENERKRESGKAWRQQHGQGRVDPVTGKSASYMAIRSRIYRQRRKDRATALAAAAPAMWWREGKKRVRRATHFLRAARSATCSSGLLSTNRLVLNASSFWHVSLAWARISFRFSMSFSLAS